MKFCLREMDIGRLKKLHKSRNFIFYRSFKVNLEHIDMVIPTFERSLDLLMDNDFELTEEEIEQMLALMGRDRNLIKNIDALVRSIDPSKNSKNELKKSIKEVVNANSFSVEQLYEKIIGDKKLISFIQELLLKRMID